eukprot:1157263-Pelagomonas_calceolata.AAC.5
MGGSQYELPACFGLIQILWMCPDLGLFESLGAHKLCSANCTQVQGWQPSSEVSSSTHTHTHTHTHARTHARTGHGQWQGRREGDPACTQVGTDADITGLLFAVFADWERYSTESTVAAGP